MITLRFQEKWEIYSISLYGLLVKTCQIDPIMFTSKTLFQVTKAFPCFFFILITNHLFYNHTHIHVMALQLSLHKFRVLTGFEPGPCLVRFLGPG